MLYPYLSRINTLVKEKKKRNRRRRPPRGAEGKKAEEDKRNHDFKSITKLF